MHPRGGIQRGPVLSHKGYTFPLRSLALGTRFCDSPYGLLNDSKKMITSVISLLFVCKIIMNRLSQFSLRK